MSAQSSREDGELWSNKATSGSSDLDTDEPELKQTRSRSSKRGRQRPMMRRSIPDLQTALRDSRDPTGATQGLPNPGNSNSPFRGLTPPPLPSVMLPSTRRPLDEILGDRKSPERDKLSAEIDRIAEGGSPEPYIPRGDPFETQNDEPGHPGRRKENGSSADLSATRTTVPDTNSGRREDRPPDRCSARIRDAARQGAQS